jgi:hypothetical protein
MKRRLPRKGGRARYRFAYELLECAKRDFFASSILFQAKVYPLAVFHLQQAAEKADKSYLTYGGYLEEEEMRRAGHDRIRAERYIEPKMQAVLEELEVIHPGSTDLRKCGWSMVKLRPSPYELSRASRSQILPLVFGLDMDEMMKSYRERKKLQRVVKKKGGKIKSTVPVLRELILLVQLTKIAILLTPHAWTTRYPTTDTRTLSPKDYTPELGIVQVSNELIISVGQAISTIDQRYRDEKKAPYSKYGRFRVTTRPGTRSKGALVYRFEYDLLRTNFSLRRDL